MNKKCSQNIHSKIMVLKSRSNWIFGNDDTTQEDNMRRQILLSLRSTSSSRSYTLQLDFENTDVDWLVLSETRISLQPPEVMVYTAWGFYFEAVR